MVGVLTGWEEEGTGLGKATKPIPRRSPLLLESVSWMAASSAV